MDVEFFKSFFGVSPQDRVIPTLKPAGPLEDIVENRAKDIADKYSDIFLMWSGGVDSTLAFYALIKTGINITVVYSDNSILEYPKLGKELLDGKFHNVELLKIKDFTEIVRATKPTITGELGDQIIGSATFIKYNKNQRVSSYKNTLPPELIDGFKERVFEVTKRTNLSLGEYLWALNFIFKYTDVAKRINSPDMFKECFLVHFFDAEQFQSWAVENYSENSSYDRYNEYKMAYKRYIFSQNKDEIYMKYKTKVPSLCQAIKN